MRLSCWQRGQRIGSASQTFLMSPRHFFDGIRRGLNAETSMNSPSGAATTSASVCLSRWPRILLEYFQKCPTA